MPEKKEYILSKSARIATKEATYTRGEILSADAFKSLPAVFQAKCEVFDKSKKEHLKLSQNHESEEFFPSADTEKSLEALTARVEVLEAAVLGGEAESEKTEPAKK